MRTNRGNRYLGLLSKLAVPVLAGVLIVLWNLVSVSATKDETKPDNDTPRATRVILGHNYDEVFEATQTAIERKGWLINGKNKDKGTIDFTCSSGVCYAPISLKIQPLESTSEPQIRIIARLGLGEITTTLNLRGWLKKCQKEWSAKDWDLEDLWHEIPKVLATYR